MRSCVGCRARRNVEQLVRVAVGTDGSLGLGRALPGRGAWLCARSAPSCLRLARRRDGLAKALRRPVPGDELDRLAAVLADAGPVPC